MSRTPYSPFVEKATAPEPWKLGLVLAGCVRVVPSIPSDFVGIESRRGFSRRQRRAVRG